MFNHGLTKENFGFEKVLVGESKFHGNVFNFAGRSKKMFTLRAVRLIGALVSKSFTVIF